MSDPRGSIAVVQSRAVARELGLDLPVAEGIANGIADGEAPPWRLERGPGGALALVRPDGVRVAAELAAGRARSRSTEAALAGQPLARALGIARLTAALGRPPRLIDATAGLGVDGWQAAALGARVTLLERHPVVHALLADALSRAHGADDARARAIAARIDLERADAVARLRTLADAPPEARPELVYLDPMYPPTRRRGRSRKGIESLHALVGPQEDDGRALLGAALGAATRRVIVKRPAGAPPLAAPPGVRPDPIEAPNTRWDRYPSGRSAVPPSAGAPFR